MQDNPQRTKLLLSILPFSALFFFLTLSSFSSLQTTKPHHPTTTSIHHRSNLHYHQRVQVAHSTCDGTLYPELCVSTLTTVLPDLHTKTLPEIISATVNHTVGEVRATAFNVTAIRKKLPHLTPLEIRALDDCLQLFDETVSELKSAISDLSSKSPSAKYTDLQTLLSAAMTNQATCLDGFAYSKSRTKIRKFFRRSLHDISRQVSNSLALLKRINGTRSGRKTEEVFPEYGRMSGGFPTWLTRKDRALLQASVNATPFDLVVAKDGSGNFTTIGEAVQAAPNSSATRFVIYIKAGAYYEYVEVISRKTMLMFVGDGIGQTLIKGNRSVVDGWTTFRSATVAVVGNGFIAKGITFENYAGPSKLQAVTVRSGSDFSAFYKCSFVGYQDTLYVHSLRQFYRECDIYGTIDFIFGNAAVVFQKSNLYARQPNPNQQNIFTAQGRDDPNQNTGISILECKIAAGSELIPVQSMFKTYLGRPWRQYSRTVIMRSNIGDLIDPAGWVEWSGDFGLATLYYGEYLNRGPGSNTSARVTWPGYKVITNETEASQFTVGNFIQGGEWLNTTGIPFYLGLNCTGTVC